MELSTIDKLMELKKLYEAGILTQEELEAEKQKVLDNETAEETPQTQQEVVVQEAASTSAIPEEKSSNKKLWVGIGIGVLFLIIIICAVVSNNKTTELPSDYDTDEIEAVADEDCSLSDTYTEVTTYEEEDDLYEIDEWVGTFVITGCIYRTSESKAILTLKKTDRKSYYTGTMYLMLGTNEGNGQFDAYHGTMTANVKAKQQDDQVVVVLDDFTIGEGLLKDWFDTFKQGQQIFCITNSYGFYSVRALEEMERMFEGYACDNEIYKQ